MVVLNESLEDQRLAGIGVWKPGWYFEHEDGDWGGPFATKEEAESALVLVQQGEATLEQLLLWQGKIIVSRSLA